MTAVAFFNNKGGVGKTSLVYHLAWMFSDLGLTTVVADLDPQSNLTAAFLSEERQAEIWEGGMTVYSAVRPLLEERIGDVQCPHLEAASDNLYLIPGDLALSQVEDELSEQWPKCLEGKNLGPFRVITAFWRVVEMACEAVGAPLALIDVGPNLGAINRSALIASDHVVVPLAPDLYSLQGLRNLGPTLADWRKGWKKRMDENPDPSFALPQGNMEPVGYTVTQHSVRLDRPTKSYDLWISRIPAEYRRSLLGESGENAPGVTTDVHCLALLKHYRGLMALAQEAGKPIFHLRSADGAIGSHAQAALDARGHFEALARRIAREIGLDFLL